MLASLKHRLQTYKPYIIASEIKHVLGRYLKDIEDPDGKVICLKPQKNLCGDALLSIWNEPFIFKRNQPRSKSYHSHYWESLEMAKTFLDLGYGVDVIHYHNTKFIPEKAYSVVVDERRNLERLAPLLTKDCVKIMHIDTAHMLFHNAAECRRLLELQQRRRITLRPRRFEMPNWGIEHADYATVLGNEFTIDTYRYANKPMFRVPISTPVVYPWPEDKNVDACRNHFLWFGTGGLVHKGLDLVLDAFAEMPEYHLTVCGPIQEEKDFEKAFYKELYQTPNIHTIGWVDIGSPEFIQIARNCIGLVYPSCSEGGGGSAISCMHAGVIPMVSYEASVDVDDFGCVLKDCSISEIRESVRMISSLPTEELKTMSRKAWEYVRANHTTERFAEEYRKIVETITTAHGKADK